MYLSLEKPVKTTEYALLILSRRNSTKWIFQHMETQIKPLLDSCSNFNLKIKLINLIGSITSQFNQVSDAVVIQSVQNWLMILYKGKYIFKNLNILLHYKYV